jgi:hypothetical protein
MTFSGMGSHLGDGLPGGTRCWGSVKPSALMRCSGNCS